MAIQAFSVVGAGPMGLGADPTNAAMEVGAREQAFGAGAAELLAVEQQVDALGLRVGSFPALRSRRSSRRTGFARVSQPGLLPGASAAILGDADPGRRAADAFR